MNANETAMKSTIGDYLLAAVWIGFLGGIFQILLFLLKHALGILTLIGPQVMWLWPPLFALLFLPPALVLWTGSLRWPRFLSVRNVSVLLVFLGALSALHTFDVQLGRPPLYLLALGMAVQSWRMIGERSDAYRRLVRRSMPWLLGTVALAGGAINGAMALRERRAENALPAPAAGAPNVLLIILDTVRGLSLGLYTDSTPTTPQLERWAGRGVVFDRAVAPSSWTAPSHGTMWTGHWPHNHTADWSTGLDGAHRTMAEALHDRGYRTGAFIANNRYVTRDGGFGRGFVHYEDHLQSLGTAFGGTWFGRFLFHKESRLGRWLGVRDVAGRKYARHVTGPFLRWVGQDSTRPFLAVLNYMDAHDPFLPPEPFATSFGVKPPRSFFARVAGRLRRMTGSGAALPANDERSRVAAELTAYKASIAYLDSDMGRLLDELERRGILANTLVVLVSDHGEEFAEHGSTTGHGKSLYWPTLQVPLILLFPGRVPAGSRVSATASLRNLPVTVMELVAGTRDSFPGESWERLWRDSLPVGDVAISELSYARGSRNIPVARGDMKSVTIGQYHYILNGDGSEELYDIAADPWEQRNLLGQPGTPPPAQFREALAGIPKRQRELRRRF